MLYRRDCNGAYVSRQRADNRPMRVFVGWHVPERNPEKQLMCWDMEGLRPFFFDIALRRP